MKNKNIKKICALALIAQGALAAEDSNDQRIEKYIDIGTGIVTKESFKFGEYNGMDKTTINGSFGVIGGEAINTSTGTKLWSVQGRDVGTTSRSFNGSMSDQGKWNFKVGFDQLRHNITNTYQTPLQGEMGGNNFTLPTNFGTVLTTGNGTRDQLSAAQLGSFASKEVYSSRTNTSLNANYIINPSMNVQFDYNHLAQSGAKLLGAANQGTITVGGSTGKAEAINIIMNPTKFDTDTFSLGMNWYTEKSYLNLNYYGSLFKNAFESVSYQDAMVSGAAGACGSACFTTQRIGLAPNNALHQLNLSGGYDLTATTKLTGGLSYGRNTQDQKYISTTVYQDALGTSFDHMQTGGLPTTSLEGLVINTHANLRLTNQSFHDWTLTAGVKYNGRQDKTASKTYVFKDISSSATDTTTINAPYSNSKLESELAGDYRITKDQKLRLAFERENIHRWCDGIASGYECVASPKSAENRLSANYKIKATDTLRFNTGYTYANKQGEFNHSYVGNIQGTGTAGPGSSNNGDGTKTTTNGGNIYGFESKLFASRQEHIIKAGTTWEVLENLDMSLSGRYIQDKYEASLGVQASRGESAAFESNYIFNDHHSANFFANWQTGYRDLLDSNNGTVSTRGTSIWSNRIKEEVTEFGVGTHHTGLLDGKMEVSTELSISMDKTKWSTEVPYLATCSAAGTMSCGSIEMKNHLTTFKVRDSYNLNKNGKVSVEYALQQNTNDDFFYNIYQRGYTPATVMPTNEQNPTYDVSLITLTYTYIF